jgi:hypothetical protein
MISLGVGAAEPAETFPARVVERVADVVAAEKKPYVVHPRYGYQTTGEYPKLSYVFHVGDSGEWPATDRAKAKVHALETNVLAVAATKPFCICIGDDAAFSSSADGALHRVSFERSGLLLTRLAAPIILQGLAPTDSVQVHAELFPTHMLVQKDESAQRFAFEGRCFLYKNGTVTARDELVSGMPSWLEFLPVVTDEEKDDIAAAANLSVLPDWTTGQVAAALVEARTPAEKPHTCFKLDAKTQVYEATGPPYFTVDAGTGTFKTADQGVKYADTHLVPANTRITVETTSILRQVQCPFSFVVHAGPGGATALQARNVGGVHVVDFPSGLPATTLSPCVLFVVSKVDGAQTEAEADHHPLCSVTFLCESIGAAGSARVRDLENLVVRAVSSRNVIVSAPAPRADGTAKRSIPALASASARPHLAPAPAAVSARVSGTSTASGSFSAPVRVSGPVKVPVQAPAPAQVKAPAKSRDPAPAR